MEKRYLTKFDLQNGRIFSDLKQGIKTRLPRRPLITGYNRKDKSYRAEYNLTNDEKNDIINDLKTVYNVTENENGVISITERVNAITDDVNGYMVNGYIENTENGETIKLTSKTIYDGGYFKIVVNVGNNSNDYIIDARYNNCIERDADKLQFIKAYLHSIYTGKNGAYALHVTETRYLY